MKKKYLKYTTKDMHELAKKRGFKFLSEKYDGIITKHLWECSQGHTWKAIPNAIKNGNGCKKCAAAQLRSSIKDAHKIAKNRGFEFVSTEYKGMKKKHKWKCIEGHIWETKTSNIKYGNGCPRCNMLKKSMSEEKCRFAFEQLTGKLFPSTRQKLHGSLELDGYCEELNMAFEYQGEQHYNPQHYFNKKNKSNRTQQDIDKEKRDTCRKENIKLILIPHQLDTNKIIKDIQEKLKNSGIKIKTDIDWNKFKSCSSLLKSIQGKLKKRKILLVSKTYLGSHYKHDFKCLKCNFEWKAVLKDVRDKSGCPK